MSSGDGVFLYDTTGKQYLDCIGGWAVTTLGHSHPVLLKALADQSKQLWNASPYFYNTKMLEFAEILCKKTQLDKVFFCSTGAEANESALKLARKYGAKHKGGAYKVITLKQSFHGRTLAMMSATGKEAWKHLYEPKVPGFKHVDINDIEQVKQAIDEETVAVMLEPIQGEGGVHTCDLSYLQKLRELCNKENLLLILDEVQTGVGRTGRFCCFEHFGILPDILSLAKGLGGGYPIAAMLCKASLDIFEAGDQGATYSAQPLGMAVGLAVCQYVSQPGFLDQVEQVGDYLREQLRLLEPKVSGVRGKGLLIAFDVQQDAAHLSECLLQSGVIVNASSSQSLRLIPPLIFTKEHADLFIKTLRSFI